MQALLNTLHILRAVSTKGRLPVLFATATLILAACAPTPRPEPTETTTPPQEETTAAEETLPDTAPSEELPDAFPETTDSEEQPLVSGPRKTRVALLLPLSGRASAAGQALMNAAQLSLFDHATENFELIIRDTAGSALRARRAAEEVVSEGAELIIGPLFGQSVTAVAPVARQAGVSVMAFSNDIAVAGDDVYLLGLTPEQQIDRVVSYAREQGLSRFALLAPSNAFGNRISSAMSQSVNKSGGFLVRNTFYLPGAQDQRETIKALANFDQRNAELKARRRALNAEGTAAAKRALNRLKGRDTLNPPDFEAILVAASGRDLLTLAPLLNFYDVDPRVVRYLGTAQWDNPRLGREPTLTGSWFAGYSPKNWTTFSERYRLVYGDNAPRLAALAYDAMAMAAIMARSAESRAMPVDFSRQMLTRSAGFTGINGYFRLNTDGQVERALPVLTLQRDAVEVVEEAPASLPLAEQFPAGSGTTSEAPVTNGETVPQ